MRQGLLFAVAYGILGFAMAMGQEAVAQTPCTVPPNSNNGVVQNGPPPCVVGDVTVGYGTAVTARNGADVTVNGAVTAHGYGTGVDANTNSLVIINNSVRTTVVGVTGPITASGLGLSASSSARIEANGIRLSNDGGGGAVALKADNGTIVARAITIDWPNGGGQSLIQSLNGGLIQFTPGSSISNPNGGVPSALLADGIGSRIEAVGLITSMGSAGGITGAKAQNGGSITFSGASSISFTGGGGNTGVSVSGAGSVVSTDGLVITATNGGGNDVGVNADNGGRAVLTGGSINIAGAGGGERGLRATGTGSVIAATGTAITVTGPSGNAGVNALNGGRIETSGGSVSVTNGAGGLLQSGGTTIMTGTNVTASGTGGIGFQFNNGGNNTLNYQGATIQASAASFSVQGAIANIDLTNTTAVANNNTLLQTGNGGNTMYNARNSILQGVVTTPAGNTSALSLTQGTVWTMTGNSKATSVANDASQIIYTAPLADPSLLASYKTLTVTNYVGRGGSVALNTYLGADGSPSDRLVIDGGSASGRSGLRITNTTGPGELTTGDGIRVVQAINGGTTAPAAFGLSGPVAAGPYEYLLFRGGVTPGNETTGSCATSPVRSPRNRPARPRPIRPHPARCRQIQSRRPRFPPVRRRCRPVLRRCRSTGRRRWSMPGCRGSPASSAWRSSAPSTSARASRACLTRTAAFRSPGAAPSARGPSSAAAGRWRRNSTAISSASRPAWISARPRSGRAIATISVSSSAMRRPMATCAASRSASAVWPAARCRWMPRASALYWTHVGPGGWYLDSVLMHSWLDGEPRSNRGVGLDLEGHATTASVEGGYPIWLTDKISLEPQAQLIWQHVAFDPTQDRFSSVIFDADDAWTGRIGARLQGTFQDGTTTWRPYLKVNLWHGFDATDRTQFSNVVLPASFGATSLEVGAGVVATLSETISLFAVADYTANVNGPHRETIEGNLGIRVTW